MHRGLTLAVMMTCCSAATMAIVRAGGATPLKIVAQEFVFTAAPFPSAHASTLVETPAGFVAAWFGGTGEKHPDVGIWSSRRDDRGWSAPAELANGVQP